MKHAMWIFVAALATDCLATPPAQPTPEDTAVQFAPAHAAWSVRRCAPPSDENDALPIVPSALLELEQDCVPAVPPIPDRIYRYGAKSAVNAAPASNDATTSTRVSRSITARTRTSGGASFNAGAIRPWQARQRAGSTPSESGIDPTDALGRNGGVDVGGWMGVTPLNRPAAPDDSTL